MDVYLPDGDGLEVVRTLLSGHRAARPCWSSRPRTTSPPCAAVQLGAVHYLVKPFGFAELGRAARRRSGARRTSWRVSRRIAPSRTSTGSSSCCDRRRPPRPSDPPPRPDAPAVFDAVAGSPASISATDVAAAVGISRTTAQRCLTQLEQSGVLRLELRYGTTGRPEHRYAVKRG